eukprot:g4896.t1
MEEAFLREVAPPLDGTLHKGQAGRIGVLGGSLDYTGAPYYAGKAALRTGADLVYIATAVEATIPIKAYSPELMVSGIYSAATLAGADAAEREQEEMNMLYRMSKNILPRLHGLVIGPGLGRDPAVLRGASLIIAEARKIGIPMVIDADGLCLVNENPSILRGCANAVLTPNAHEYRRLSQSLFSVEDAGLAKVTAALAGPVVFLKGDEDLVCSPGMAEPMRCKERGAPRRPGGVGDLLAGSLVTVLSWASRRNREPAQACAAASALIRRASRLAFESKKRGMLAPDILEEIPQAFESLCPCL